MRTRKARQAGRTHWLRTTLIVLLICGIAGLILTSVKFFGDPDPTYAGATLELTFDGAAEGVAPNGARFDISGITSDEVLGAAIAEAGADYAPAQLRDCLEVKGVYPEDMASQVMSYESLLNFTANRELTVGDFHPTTFRIRLFNNFDRSISRGKLTALLSGILSAYETYFARVYSNGLDERNALFDLDVYDYPQQLEIIQGHFETISQYANEMYTREPSFRLGGKGFNDISVRLNNLIDSDISRLNADLTMNALTRNTARLLTQYQFEIRDLNNRLEKQNQRLEELDKLVESYDKNEIIYLSTSDSLTKIDGNSSETYDKLVNERKEVADGITEIKSQINTFQQKQSDLLKEKTPAQPTLSAQESEAGEGEETEVEIMTEEEIAEAAAEAERLARQQTLTLENNIALLVAKGETIIGDFKRMLDAYNAQEINEATVTARELKYRTPKVLSGAFVKKAVEVAGPVCAIGLMVCLALLIRSRRREEKQKAA